jgi:HD-GYP domain-containing protein (c-di-GMP phosphodiesterase class II)
MSASRASISAADVPGTLLQRCLELGIPLWQCDGAGAIVSQPEEPLSIRSWLQSPALRMRVESAALAWAKAAEPAATELFEGCWLLPLVEKRGTRRIGLMAALALCERVLGAGEFYEICQLAQLDATEVARAMQPLLKRGPHEVDQLSKVLLWSQADLARAAHDKRALDGFSQQLAQAYEETNLLFRLAGLMDSAADPAELIQVICDELHRVLPFQWLAIRFSERSREVPSLAGRLLIAGRPALAQQALDDRAAGLIESQNTEGWARLLGPARSDLAALAGSEVLAEPIRHDQRFIGVLLAGNKTGPDPEISSAEMQFTAAAAGFVGIFHENIARFKEQKALFTGTLQALTASIDAKDPYTCGHSERVALLAAQMAAALGLERREIEKYRIAGLVHDVGKIGVPEAVLCKLGRLTNDEFAQIKRHPEIGHGILKDIPLLAPMLPGVLHHHEQWGGSGYPHRLRGEEIPLIARVLALADSFDAMSSTRSYRPAMTREAVLAEIRKCAGTQFDPSLAPIFISLDFSEYDAALPQRQSPGAAAA